MRAEGAETAIDRQSWSREGLGREESRAKGHLGEEH